ncbi:hypothetical protein [Vibrio harveyi]|uniref:hypothetical protein n=1 Tax=Vibrio harveyi TaxID=669 RepID=UPI0002EFDE40|nr:hypothetical protein [Vibrio harveyi]EKO3860589.1 hypothetical protein [Vibrio harveyi]
MELKYAKSEDLNKFAKHVPISDEITTQLLKGHLLVEEITRDLFKTLLSNPDALQGSSGTSLDCHQVICLVESLLPRCEHTEWVWRAAKKLNKIRNSLAHQLEPKGLDHMLDDFLKLVQSKSPHYQRIKRNLDVPRRTLIYGALLALCSELSALVEDVETKA